MSFALTASGKKQLLKISLVDSPRQRRLVVEGKLIAPWAGELRSACEIARADLNGRELVVELKHLTAISQEGENVLGELITKKVRLRGNGIFTKQLLKQLGRKVRRSLR